MPVSQEILNIYQHPVPNGIFPSCRIILPRTLGRNAKTVLFTSSCFAWILWVRSLQSSSRRHRLQKLYESSVLPQVWRTDPLLLLLNEVFYQESCGAWKVENCISYDCGDAHKSFIWHCSAVFGCWALSVHSCLAPWPAYEFLASRSNGSSQPLCLSKPYINSPVWVVFTNFRKLRNKSGSATNSPTSCQMHTAGLLCGVSHRTLGLGQKGLDLDFPTDQALL